MNKSSTMQTFSPLQPSRAADISQTLHQAAEANCGGMLWLAVDSRRDVGELFASELQNALDSVIAVAGAVHPEMDKASQPRWLPLNTEQARGSFLLQDSIEQALAELEPKRLQQGRGRRIAGWIELDGDVRQTAVHLGRQMIRCHPQGGLCLLRLHDPAVMWALWPLLTPAQQRQLLGPVNAWWLLDPSGKLTALRSQDEAPAQPWTAEQWLDIENITPMNQALRQWFASPVAAARDAPSLSQARSDATQALRRARAYGIADRQDLAAFALHALTVDSGFDSHPVVRDILRRCCSMSNVHAEHYSALSEELDAEAWKRIRTDLRPAR